MKHLRYSIIIIFVLGAFLQLRSQIFNPNKIEIGQSAEEVKAIIQYQINNSANTNSSWDVRYYNGKISEVMKCYTKQYLIDFRIRATFCNRYMMINNKLAYILIQYEDVSVEQLIEIYDRLYVNTKYKGLYFSDDFQHFNKIYLTKNGLATVEYRKNKPNQLPQDVLKLMSKKSEKDKEVINSVPPKKQDQTNAQSGVIYYEVQPGESLRRIAKKYFGNMEMYTKIMKDNNITSPDQVYPGLKLKIIR